MTEHPTRPGNTSSRGDLEQSGDLQRLDLQRLDLKAFLAGAHIEDSVAALRPDYRALLIAVDGLSAHPADTHEPGNAGQAHVEQLLTRAEQSAKTVLDRTPVEELPHVAAWREAYRAFGAKPQRTRNSLEALLRRAERGLPRVNPLTDLYNAISVLHQVPLGGEDLRAYAGVPRLLRADGSENFDTTADGAPHAEHPEPGEVVWCDEAGVTCRRWNWRQGRRTQLTEQTTAAFFILDALAPMTDAALQAAADELVENLSLLNPGIDLAQRLIRAT